MPFPGVARCESRRTHVAPPRADVGPSLRDYEIAQLQNAQARESPRPQPGQFPLPDITKYGSNLKLAAYKCQPRSPSLALRVGVTVVIFVMVMVTADGRAQDNVGQDDIFSWDLLPLPDEATRLSGAFLGVEIFGRISSDIFRYRSLADAESGAVQLMGPPKLVVGWFPDRPLPI